MQAPAQLGSSAHCSFTATTSFQSQQPLHSHRLVRYWQDTLPRQSGGERCAKWSLTTQDQECFVGQHAP